MNYVKHLSIALLVLVATSAVAKDSVKVQDPKDAIGWQTPGGTALDKDSKGVWILSPASVQDEVVAA